MRARRVVQLMQEPEHCSVGPEFLLGVSTFLSPGVYPRSLLAPYPPPAFQPLDCGSQANPLDDPEIERGKNASPNIPNDVKYIYNVPSQRLESTHNRSHFKTLSLASSVARDSRSLTRNRKPLSRTTSAHTFTSFVRVPSSEFL